jgi:hemolysin III
MYLGMGWAALLCLPQMKERLPIGCIQLIVLGGVAYTAGVPFFVRDNNLDHAIWHLFVLSGSVLHWLAVFIYVAPIHLLKA